MCFVVVVVVVVVVFVVLLGFFFFFLRSPAISLGFTTLGEIFAYVTVFLVQPLR